MVGAGMVGVGLLASGCADPAGGAGAAGSAGGGTATLTYLNTLPIETLTYAPELVADTKGFFAAQHVKVDFQFVNGTPPAIAAVMSGRGQLTRAGDADIIKSIVTKGAKITNVGTVQKGGATIRIVSDTRSAVRKPADLRGKTIGESALGGTTEGLLTLLLSSAGMKLSDLHQQVVPLSAGTFSLVQKGRLDGFMPSLDTATALKAAHKDAVTFDLSKYIAAGSQAYITSPAQAGDPKTRDAIHRYLRAIKSAIQFIVADQKDGYAKTMKAIGTKYHVPAFDQPEVAKASLDGYVASWTYGGADGAVQTDHKRWKAVYGEMVKAGMVPGGKDPEQWVDDRMSPAS
ncbi:hypothetical protein Sm713_65160 [Streptomyces sp. TS71-3]|nr:hypothetical protein Sm713_65160 [Streptomyces sp. TS71-3]